MDSIGIDLFNIIKNSCQNSEIMAVVKANAYGHSVEYIAPVLEKNGADRFAVSNIDEAIQLREIGITKPILILGYTPVSYVNDLCKYDISQCVYSLEYAQLLSSKAVENKQNIKIHIKLDTGMSRLGFNFRNDNLEGINDVINASKLAGFEIEGIFTHFSSSDRDIESDDNFTDIQYDRFTKAIEILKKENINSKVYHCCNSAALITDNHKQLSLCRPGIILYGLKPSNASQFNLNFLPVMTLKSVVSMVKEIDENDTVSYGRTFKANKKIKIATVAAGYADGYPRALSNKGYVIINGQKAPILGRICMDQMCVDVSDIKDVKMGDEVILFGKEISVDILAEKVNTINYEIVCGISPRVPRVIIDK